MSSVRKMSIAALICGIASIVLPFVDYIRNISLIAAIAGIVLGALSLGKIKRGCDAEPNTKGFALAGLITGIVGAVIYVSLIIIGLCVVCVAVGSLGEYFDSTDWQSIIDNLRTMGMFTF